MRRCNRRPLTNRLLYAAAIRFSAARRPCTSLLDMLNVRRIFWCRFGTRFTAQLCKRWLFADRRQYALRLFRLWPGAHIVCALSRRIFYRWRGHCGMLRLFRRDRRRWRGRFCGLLDIGTSGLLLRHGCRGALRMLRFWSGPRGICTLMRRFRCMGWSCFC